MSPNNDLSLMPANTQMLEKAVEMFNVFSKEANKHYNNGYCDNFYNLDSRLQKAWIGLARSMRTTDLLQLIDNQRADQRKKEISELVVELAKAKHELADLKAENEILWRLRSS